MPDDAPIEKLLQGAFKEEERQYLAQHPAFQQQRAKTPNTIQGYEFLVEIGALLIQQRAELKHLMEGRRLDHLMRRPDGKGKA
jgi:hypothetical protein